MKERICGRVIKECSCEKNPIIFLGNFCQKERQDTYFIHSPPLTLYSLDACVEIRKEKIILEGMFVAFESEWKLFYFILF